MTSPSWRTGPPRTWTFRPTRSTINAAAPHTHGLPMPRATTAACEVLPPRLVRVPRAATMPWRSSGLVSSRTRMTSSPRSLHSTAVSASSTTRPTAAPGEALTPTVRRSLRCQVIESRKHQADELRAGHASQSLVERHESFVDHGVARCGTQPRACACPLGSGASRACRPRW